MAHKEKLYLHLNDFEKHVQTSWQNLQGDQDFCDITLTCDDKQIKSHKFILSSYSPILRNMLKNSNPNTMIFFRGVKYTDLINIVTFIYQGEVDVPKEHIDHFLIVANDLKIRGLSLEDDSDDQSPKKSTMEEKHKIQSYTESMPKVLTDDSEQKGKSNAESFDVFSSVVEYSEPSKYEEYPKGKVKKSPLKSMDTYYEQSQKMSDILYNENNVSDTGKIMNFQNSPDNAKGSYQRDENFEYDKNENLDENNYVKHVSDVAVLELEDFTNSNEIINKIYEQGNDSIPNTTFDSIQEDTLVLSKVNELTYNSFFCDKCDVNFRTNEDLISHIELEHNDKLFSCDQCKYKAKLNSVLVKHIKTFHENLKFTCDHCDYNASSKNNLHSHRQSHHKSLHPCEHCDYETNCDLKLKKHFKSSHVCDQCDFKTKVSGTLKAHINTMHGNIVYFPCNQCNYKAKQNARLQQHTEALHGNAQYSCDKCNYKTTTTGNLKRHNVENHKGIYYFCDQCENKYKSRDKLKEHINRTHKGVCYPCNECEFRATQKCNLKRHILSMHQKIKRKG